MPPMYALMVDSIGAITTTSFVVFRHNVWFARDLPSLEAIYATFARTYGRLDKCDNYN